MKAPFAWAAASCRIYPFDMALVFGSTATVAWSLVDSYHCSRYNTNTGVLTTDMFRDVFARARAILERAG